MAEMIEICREEVGLDRIEPVANMTPVTHRIVLSADTYFHSLHRNPARVIDRVVWLPSRSGFEIDGQLYRIATRRLDGLNGKRYITEGGVRKMVMLVYQI